MRMRKINFFWIFYGLVLVMLFLLSSTDLIIKEEEAEIYPVSVIIEDTSDENYVSFRKGMEQAAMEFNADVSFITLYEKGNTVQQKELMLREQEDGSRALIVAPVEEGMLAGMYQENLLSVPVICINTGREAVNGADKAAVFTFDYYEMGHELGEEILREHSTEVKIYVTDASGSDGAGGLFFRGLCDALRDAGCSPLPFTFTEEGGLGQGLLGMTEGWSRKVVLAAADPGLLARMAQYLAENEEAAAWVDGLYGRGNAVPLLNYLDKGIIQGLCVTDEFSAGYLSIKAAVDLSKSRSADDMGYLKSYYIRREDLRNEEYEKMLYPIE